MPKLTEEFRVKSAEAMKQKYPELSDDMRLKLVDEYWWWYNQGMVEGAERLLKFVLGKIGDKKEETVN